jgi:hypothetical protein
MAQARRHKGEMARALVAAGVPSMRQICTGSVDEVADWIERAGLTDQDLVIKPPKSASTDGVVKVPAGSDWRAMFSELFCRVATGDSQVDRIARGFVENGFSKLDFELKTNLRVVFLLCRVGGQVSNRAVLDKIATLPSHHFSKIHIQQGDWLKPTQDLFASLDMGFVVLAHQDAEQIAVDTKMIREFEAQLYQ